MAGLMDGLNKAVSKLQDIGEKAVDGAKELYEKAKPGIDEALKLWDKIQREKKKREKSHKCHEEKPLRGFLCDTCFFRSTYRKTRVSEQRKRR